MLRVVAIWELKNRLRLESYICNINSKSIDDDFCGKLCAIKFNFGDIADFRIIEYSQITSLSALCLVAIALLARFFVFLIWFFVFLVWFFVSLIWFFAFRIWFFVFWIWFSASWIWFFVFLVCFFASRVCFFVFLVWSLILLSKIVNLYVFDRDLSTLYLENQITFRFVYAIETLFHVLSESRCNLHLFIRK